MLSSPPSVPCWSGPLSPTTEHLLRPTVHREDALAERAGRYARTVLVALWAGALDIGVLALCIHGLGIAPLGSRALAVVLSGLVAFIGDRSFAFRAQAGSALGQARRFALAELLALPINLLTFRLCGVCAPSTAPEILGLLANALVFAAFLYPMRRWFVFNPSPGDRSMGAVTAELR